MAIEFVGFSVGLHRGDFCIVRLQAGRRNKRRVAETARYGGPPDKNNPGNPDIPGSSACAVVGSGNVGKEGKVLYGSLIMASCPTAAPAPPGYRQEPFRCYRV